jgi:hypothetical protein
MITLVLAMAASLGAEPPAATATPAAASATDGSERVCKKITYTGSRLGAVKICHSRREWDELQFEHDHLLREQQQLDRAFDNKC